MRIVDKGRNGSYVQIDAQIPGRERGKAVFLEVGEVFTNFALGNDAPSASHDACGIGSQCRGIQPAAHADPDIASRQPVLDRKRQQFAKAFAVGPGVLEKNRLGDVQAPIGAEANTLVAQAQEMTRRKAADIAIDRALEFTAIAEREKVGDPIVVECPSDRPLVAKRAQGVKIREVSSMDFYGKGYEDVQSRVPWIENTETELGWTAKATMHDILTSVFDAYAAEVTAAAGLLDEQSKG